ncbi:hypothetical protein V7793_04810 [Streptomyces sp. KLMMK]|uniref:hypothetical protein n=1 Tax=Streptomyces sp. KLMMK TaxID=3109353 RepID=UPI002FFF0466
MGVSVREVLIPREKGAEMNCAVCEMWGITRKARYVGTWSDTGKEHGRCKACLPLLKSERDAFRMIPDAVLSQDEGAKNQYYVTFSHPNKDERNVPSHVWAHDSRGALEYAHEVMFKAPDVWDGWDVEVTGGVQYGAAF